MLNSSSVNFGLLSEILGENWYWLTGVSVDLEKVEAVMSWERPKLVFEICSFLGLSGYYRCNTLKIP